MPESHTETVESISLSGGKNSQNAIGKDGSRENKMDDHFLKIQGKAELPSPIEIGHNYHVSLEGSITSKTTTDKDDGSFVHTFLFKPIKLELLDPLGKTLKLKDARSKSQLWRSRVWSLWKNSNNPTPFEEWYDLLMDSMIQGADDIISMYGK